QGHAVGQLSRDRRRAGLPPRVHVPVAFEVRLKKGLLDGCIGGKDLSRYTFATGSFATKGHKQKSQRRLANGDRRGCVSTDLLRTDRKSTRLNSSHEWIS